MANVTRTTTWSDGQTLTAAALNGEFNNLLNALNIANADISAGAAIALSKLAGTFPASQNVVGTTDSQTLTNKTLTAPAITGPTITGTIAGSPAITKPTINASVQGVQTYTPTGGGTATLDLSLANFNFITMPAGNITVALTNASVGQAFLVRVLEDSGGSRVITWFTTIKWVNGAAPTLSGANKVDTFVFICTASNQYDGYIAGLSLA